MTARLGEPAPDFTLGGTGGRDYTLSSYRGHPVVLVFYPGDDTTVCTTQLKSYTSDFGEFEAVDAQVLGLSPQGVESHEAFSAKHGFTFPLLADTDKAVGQLYGVVGPIGFYRRSVFVIDREGIVRYVHRSLTSLTYRSTDEIVKAVEAAS